MVEYTRGLHEIARDVWAWLLPDGSWGWSNAGLIAGDNASTLVDTLFDLSLTREMLEAIQPITSRRPITDAILTHANGDHCFGNELLAGSVRIHSSVETYEEIDDVPPEMLASMVKEDLGPTLTPFFQKCFGPFRFDDITLRPPDVRFDVETTLTIGGRTIHARRLGPAHTPGDVVVHVPDANALFAGDLLFIDGTPIMWSGPIDNWIKACDTMTELQPEVVVPGHGPVTTVDGIAEVRAYLSHVAEEIRSGFAAGKDWQQTAFEIDLDRFGSLPDAERVVVTTYNLYRELDPQCPESSVTDLFTLMAKWHAQRGN